MTANLQKRRGRPPSCPGGMTVKQAAQLMAVSERSVYKAREVMRLRPDLEPLIASGELSLHKAWRVATEHKSPTAAEKLVQAWNAAPLEVRRDFYEAVTDLSANLQVKQ